MLSKKFKRICSHVIAALSSIGMVSISKSSNAADLAWTTYEQGDTVTYKRAAHTNFAANYTTVSDSDMCAFTTSQNVTSKYTTKEYSNSDGTTGFSGVCTWTCKAGYYSKADGTTTTFTTTTGLGTEMTLDSTKGCVPKPTSCSSLTNATTSTPYYNSSNKAFYCQWTCNAGYSVGGGTSTTTVITSNPATSTSAMTASNTCSARTYNVHFDCTTNGYIAGTTSRYYHDTATYGSSYTINQSCVSKVAGKTFSNWTASES